MAAVGRLENSLAGYHAYLTPAATSWVRCPLDHGAVAS
jgi:hypothetical protein